MPIDIREAIDAAATEPYGFMRFPSGPGIGGHCLPVDPFYLSWRARQFGISTELIELAGKVNRQMPYHCVSKATRALNDLGRPVNGSKIALFGVSYKPGVGDIRESPAPEIIELLAELGAQIAYYDPRVPALGEMGLESVAVEEALQDTDLAATLTAHRGVDHVLIAERAPAAAMRLERSTGRLARRVCRKAKPGAKAGLQAGEQEAQCASGSL